MAIDENATMEDIKKVWQGEGAAKRFTEFVSIKAEEAKKAKTHLHVNILSDKFKEDASLLDRYEISAIDRLIMAGV